MAGVFLTLVPFRASSDSSVWLLSGWSSVISFILFLPTVGEYSHQISAQPHGPARFRLWSKQFSHGHSNFLTAATILSLLSVVMHASFFSFNLHYWNALRRFSDKLSAVWLSGVTKVCRHLLFSFHSFILKWITNVVMLTIDHISVVAKINQFLAFQWYWSAWFHLITVGWTYWTNIFYLVVRIACRRNAASLWMHVATFLVSVFHLSLSLLYSVSLENASPIPTWPAGRLRSRELENTQQGW